jgi:two-component system cell cycle response regulator DivK
MVNKVLIIDDDNRNIFALSAVLKAKGYQCLSAIGGEEGIEIRTSPLY